MLVCMRLNNLANWTAVIFGKNPSSQRLPFGVLKVAFLGSKIQLSQPGMVPWPELFWMEHDLGTHGSWWKWLLGKFSSWEKGHVFGDDLDDVSAPRCYIYPGRTGGPMDCTCMEGCTKSIQIRRSFPSMELGCFSVINAYCRGRF